VEYEMQTRFADQMHLLAFTLFGLLAASVPQPEAALSPVPDSTPES
jgi:hypothetical protein